MEGMRALISSNIFPRQILLKALEKSRRSVHFPSGTMLESSCTRFTASTMASQPTETPTPTCRGVKTLKASPLTALEMHFEVNLHNTSPTAMGRRPPPLFLEANKVAPHRWGTTPGGTCPKQRRFITLLRARTTALALSGEGQKAASLRWFALRAEGPAAVPLGKHFRLSLPQPRQP